MLRVMMKKVVIQPLAARLLLNKPPSVCEFMFRSLTTINCVPRIPGDQC